jgi:hypothetical protein
VKLEKRGGEIVFHIQLLAFKCIKNYSSDLFRSRVFLPSQMFEEDEKEK